MPTVLVAGVPGTGKGVLSSVLSCSPDLDVTFASWPNNGDHNPTQFDYVVWCRRDAAKQLQSCRRKFAMRISDAAAAELTRRGSAQLAKLRQPDWHEWDYRRTVEWPMHRIVDHFADLFGVSPWRYAGPDIYDGDAPTDETGLHPVVQRFTDA